MLLSIHVAVPVAVNQMQKNFNAQYSRKIQWLRGVIVQTCHHYIYTLRGVFIDVLLHFFWLHQLSSVTPNAQEVREHVRVMAAVFVGGAGLVPMQPTSHLGNTKTGYWY